MGIAKKFSYMFIATIFLQSCSIVVENPSDTLLRKARDLEYAGHFAEAEDAYNSVCNLNREASPMQLSILLNEARFYLRTKNYSKAISTCEKGLTACQTVFGPRDMLNVSFLFVLASAYDNSHDYNKAILIYENIMGFAPYSRCSKDMVILLPLIKLGDIEFKKNHLHEAEKLYKKAFATGITCEMVARLISYRLALCYIALNRYQEAEFYFKNSLPQDAAQSAPKDIYYRYAKFMTARNKLAGAGLAIKQSQAWYAKHKEYLDWYYSRTGPGSRCRLIDKYTAQDYDLINAIAQNPLKQ